MDTTDTTPTTTAGPTSLDLVGTFGPGSSHPNAVRVVRFALACGLSAGIADALWHRVPASLKTSTDIVGYPIIADFNYVRYFDAYYLVAFIVPALVLLLHHLLAWRGPLRKPPELRAIRPVVVDDPDSGSVRESSARSARPRVSRDLAVAAGVLLPAAAVALEISSARSPQASVPTRAGVVAGIIYVVVAVGGSALAARVSMRRAVSPRGSAPVSGARTAAIVRTGVALCIVPLLYFVSRSTRVTVKADHHVVHYPWLPWWLIVVVSVVLASWFVRRALRPGSAREARSTESAVLVLVVVPLLLFLCVATLPGASGLVQGFDDSQGLAAAQLTFHGFFPWKSLLFIHGLLADVFDYGIGMAVFANSRWGGYAGLSMFVVPATILVFYYFTVYFARRNRLLVFGVSSAMVLGLLSGFTPRFGFAPILLVLFDVMLRRRSKLWCGAFMAALVVESILTPEIGLLAVGILATLVAFEWFTRKPGTPVAPAFFRSCWCVVFGLGLTVAWTLFLAATGALSGFIDYYRIFGPGHALSGAIPTQWSLVHDPAVTIEFFLPVILIVLTIWRAVAKLRGRRPWSTRDWTMVAAASWVVLYYGKAIGRADAGHVLEAFTVAVPLLLLWVIEVLAVGDRFASPLRSRARRFHVVIPPWLLTAGAVVAVLAVAPQPVSSLRQTADHFDAVVQREPAVFRLGYSRPGVIDTTKLEDLRTVLDRYAGPDGPVFDFTNDPGVVYYLLGRVPATRFFHVSMAITGFAQRMLVSELERSRPRVVVFKDLGNGLPEWDGAGNMVRHYVVSQYLLDHYVPLVDADGTLLMVRSDFARRAPRLPPLVGPTLTANLYFDSPTCAWGDVPNFLQVPGEPNDATAIRIPTHVVGHRVTSVTGWAVDHVLLQPAREVIAVSGGHVVATAVPGASRADVAQSFKSSRVLASGFTLGLVPPHGPIQLYSLNSDGTLSPLTLGSSASAASFVTPGVARSVETADNVVHTVSNAGPRGVVDNAATNRGQVDSLDVPARTALTSYQWLELRSSRPLASGAFGLSDAPGVPSHEVTFNVLPTAGTRIAVRVGSCLQWHGYHAPDLTLVQSRLGPAPAVWFAR